MHVLTPKIDCWSLFNKLEVTFKAILRSFIWKIGKQNTKQSKHILNKIYHQNCFLKNFNSAIALRFNKSLLMESQINLYLQRHVIILCFNKSNLRLRLTPLANENPRRCLKHLQSFPLEKCVVASTHHIIDSTAVSDHDSLLLNIWVQIKNNAKLYEKQLRT